MTGRCSGHIVCKRFMCSSYWVLMMCVGTSCDKIVDLEIPATEKRYVIEANLTNAGCRVSLSSTLDLSDSNQLRIVSGAAITLTENDKEPVTLMQVNGGYYRSNGAARPGRRYELQVALDGKVLTARSTMPAVVAIDTFYLTDKLIWGRKRKIATIGFSDPEGLGNAYRLVQYVNGKKANAIFITNDLLMDGRKMAYDMLVLEEEGHGLEAGDLVTVELLSITPFMYQYWYGLEQSALGLNLSASPDNPLNSFEDGAIGYFSTHSVSTRSLIIP